MVDVPGELPLERDHPIGRRDRRICAAHPESHLARLVLAEIERVAAAVQRCAEDQVVAGAVEDGVVPRPGCDGIVACAGGNDLGRHRSRDRIVGGGPKRLGGRCRLPGVQRHPGQRGEKRAVVADLRVGTDLRQGHLAARRIRVDRSSVQSDDIAGHVEVDDRRMPTAR